MKRLSLLLAAVVATLALVGLSACSSDDGSADKDSSTDTAATSDKSSDGRDSDGDSDEGTGEDPPGENTDDGGSSSVDDSLVDQLITSMTTDDNTLFTGFSEDKARCYAEANIRIIGADRVREAIEKTKSQPEGDDPFALDVYGYDELGITKAQAGDIYDAGRDCGIDFRSLMLEAMSEDAEIENVPPAVMKCIEEAVTEDALRNFMVSLMAEGMKSTPDPAAFELFDKLMECDTEFGGA